MGQADYERWIGDYADDLTRAGFDATDVRIACRNWRDSEERKMPTPGQLLAYCRKVFRADRPALPPPIPEPRVSPEERAQVGQMMREWLAEMKGAQANRMDFKRLARRPGETEVQQAERLWPNHRVDRMRAAGRL